MKLRVIQARGLVSTINPISPSKIDCIDALKSMIELESKLKDLELNLPEDIRNTIYGGI